MMRTNDRNDRLHVKFERPLEARVMAIDGTWGDECSLIDISETEAEIEMAGRGVALSEFFLILTRFGNPVFRRCTREWVHGANMGVSFKNTSIGIRSLRKVQQEAAPNE